MAKTIEDFREDLRLLRAELYQSGENADVKLLGSYIDRLLISLEGLADSLESIDISMEELASAEGEDKKIQITETECACPCCCGMEAAPARKAKKTAKAKKARKTAKAKKKGKKGRR
jgi:hypothetical protein